MAKTEAPEVVERPERRGGSMNTSSRPVFKDFFGTVIEPGDAVLIAWGEPGKGTTRGELIQCHAVRRANGLGLVFRRSDDGRPCKFAVHSYNVISMKSVVRQ